MKLLLNVFYIIQCVGRLLLCEKFQYHSIEEIEEILHFRKYFLDNWTYVELTV